MPENNDIYLDKKEKNIGNLNQYLTFKLEEEYYGLQLEKAKEIIKPPKITNVPNTPKHVMGVINIRGKVTPVIDLKEKLGLVKKNKNKDNKKIIIINIDGIMVGLYIDDVREVLSINTDQIEKSTDGNQSLEEEYIKGVFTSNDNLVVIINIEEILFDNNSLSEEVKDTWKRFE